jgi:hypothetical protein
MHVQVVEVDEELSQAVSQAEQQLVVALRGMDVGAEG